MLSTTSQDLVLSHDVSIDAALYDQRIIVQTDEYVY